MKHWTATEIFAWSLRVGRGITPIAVGKMKGYAEDAVKQGDVVNIQMIACGTTWDDVARRLKAEPFVMPSPLTQEYTLSTEYWDCECQEGFIHPNSKMSCEACGAFKEDQPPSRSNEVEIMFPTPERIENNLRTLQQDSAIVS